MNNCDAWMDAIVEDGDKIWFSLGNCNGLFCYDKSNKTTIRKGTFPGEKIFEQRLHGAGMKIENKIYFSPVKAKNIAIYNTVTNQFVLVPIDYEVKKDFRCFNMARWNNYLYFISTAFQPLIIRLDMSDLSIIFYQYDLEGVDLDKDFMSRETVILQKSLYFTLVDKPIVMEFDMEQGIFIEHQLPTTDCFNTISFYQNAFVLGGKYSIVKWSLVSNRMKTFNDFPQDYGMQVLIDGEINSNKGFHEANHIYDFPFFKSIVINDKLLLLSAVMNMSILFDLHTGSIEECGLCEKETEKDIQNNKRITKLKYLFIESSSLEEIYFFSIRDMALYSTNKELTKKIKYDWNFCIDINDTEMVLEQEKGIYENFFVYHLDTFLKNIKMYQDISKTKESKLGKKIYQAMG